MPPRSLSSNFLIAYLTLRGLSSILILNSRGLLTAQALELSSAAQTTTLGSHQGSSPGSLPLSSHPPSAGDEVTGRTQPQSSEGKTGSKFTYLTSSCQWYTVMDINSESGTVMLFPSSNVTFSSLTMRFAFNCAWRVRTPSGKYIKIKVKDDPWYSCVDRPVQIGDTVYKNVAEVVYPVNVCVKGKHQVTYSISNVIYVNVPYAVTLPPDGQPCVTFSFEATDVSGRLTLPLVMTSETTGHVLSHEGADRESLYLPLMNATARVNVPRGYVVLISFQMFQVDNPSLSSCYNNDRLTLYDVSNGSVLITMSSCKTDIFYPRILERSLLLRFVTDYDTSNFGFKMLFTLLSTGDTPNQVQETGLWNCSHPSYSQIKEHFECNLEIECHGREDERNCPFTSPACEGSLALPNSCLTLITKRLPITWYEAERQCQKQDSRLVSLNTQHKWMLFLNFFHYGKRQWPVHIGARKILSGDRFPRQYWRSWLWSDRTVVYGLKVSYRFSSSQVLYLGWENYACLYFDITSPDTVFAQQCNQTRLVYSFICERTPSSFSSQSPAPAHIAHVTESEQQNLRQWTTMALTECQQGQFARDFLSCESSTHCRDVETEEMCAVPGGGVMPKFSCITKDHVHYTLVCDFRPDCQDGSDELFCVYPSDCPDTTCSNAQCVFLKDMCDVMENCVDGSDELGCRTDEKIPISNGLTYLPSPALVHLDGRGKAYNEPLEDNSICPDTHFLCPESYCVPVFLRCNGVFDCPGKEDEAECENYTCPGFYQCRKSIVCLHVQYLCDKVYHCPLQDDEWMCDFDLDCPEGCLCQGLSFVCRQPFPAENYPDLRYLDGRGSKMRIQDIGTGFFLIYLSLAECGLQFIDQLTFPNLQVLDVSENELEWLDMKDFLYLRNLKVLVLSKNPLQSIFNSEPSTKQDTLSVIDMSFTALTIFDSEPFVSFPRLSKLSLTHTAIKSISDDGFKFAANLAELNLSGSDVRTFPVDVFKGLANLQLVVTDNYKLCCKATLPELFDEKNCLAPQDEVSSCDDLLRSDAYRGCLWLFSALSIFGNGGSLLVRLLLQKTASKSGYNVLVTHLGVADLLMGVYLAIVGGADLSYRGRYLWNENNWRNSHLCHLAGFLSLLSKEMSALTICIITLDRFIVLHFPFTPFRLQKKSAAVVAGICWFVSMVIATVPLLPMTSHWEFYSQTGVCIPLPITRKAFSGQNYSFGVLIVFNFVLFLLVAFGQAFIFWSLRSNLLTSETTKKSQDLTIARRLITIVVTDFFCWFPVGLLGLLAATGTPISGELNVAMTIFVLPLNPALNPFLYTFNMVMEKRRKAEQAHIRKWLEEKVCQQNSTKESHTKTAKSLDIKKALDHLKVTIEEGGIHSSYVMTYLSRDGPKGVK